MIIDTAELEECCPVDCQLTIYVRDGVFVNWAFEISGETHEYQLVGGDIDKLCATAKLEMIGMINEVMTK